MRYSCSKIDVELTPCFAALFPPVVPLVCRLLLVLPSLCFFACLLMVCHCFCCVFFCCACCVLSFFFLCCVSFRLLLSFVLLFVPLCLLLLPLFLCLFVLLFGLRVVMLLLLPFLVWAVLHFCASVWVLACFAVFGAALVFVCACDGPPLVFVCFLHCRLGLGCVAGSAPVVVTVYDKLLRSLASCEVSRYSSIMFVLLITIIAR